MTGLGTFHDPAYDGIVLKIPSWFININDIEPDMDKLLQLLSACNKSAMHPDHVNNLYELENRSTKKELVQQRKEEKNKAQIAKEEHRRKVMAGEIYELEWKKYDFIVDGHLKSALILDGKEFDLQENVFTKGGLKSDFISAFKKQYPNALSLKKFCEDNKSAYSMEYLFKNIPDWAYTADYNIFQSTKGWECLGISLDVLCVKYDYSVGRKYINHRVDPLAIDANGIMYIENGHTKKTSFEGFERNGLLLIKA